MDIGELFVYFNNKTLEIPRWVVITKKEKEHLLREDSKVVIKPIPKAAFSVNDRVYIKEGWLFKKKKVEEIWPIFHDRGFKTFYYSVVDIKTKSKKSHNPLLEEHELHHTPFNLIKKFFKRISGLNKL